MLTVKSPGKEKRGNVPCNPKLGMVYHRINVGLFGNQWT
jgi:hypothetical protein